MDGENHGKNPILNWMIRGENPLFSEFHPDVFSSFFGNKSLRLPRGSTSRGSPLGHGGCDGLDLATLAFLLAAGGRTPGR